jgi:hypothetical protein
MKQFGGRVETVWAELRPTTRGLIERALQTAPIPTRVAGTTVQYDARADQELSRLLIVLDERALDTNASLPADQETELRRFAETCAEVLQEKTRSAEVFTQLVRRAIKKHDYTRLDALADTLRSFAPSEICELARSSEQVVRALGHETLAQFPTSTLVGLLADPVDAEIARDALRLQAIEYGSEEAREVVNALAQGDPVNNEF